MAGKRKAYRLPFFNVRAMNSLRCVAIIGLTAAAMASAASTAGAATADPHALFARERRAVGGDAWRGVAALRTTGTVISGGVPSPFTQVVDHRTGWQKAVTRNGSVTDVSGYDGLVWDFQGGPVTDQTLPGLRADNVTQAYVARDGWWRSEDPATMKDLGSSGGDDGVRVTPAGGSPIDVWFDRRSGLIDRLVAHTDYGLSTTVMSDYRTVGNLVVAYLSVSTDPAGAVTTAISASVIPLASIAPAELARPAPISSGRIAGGSEASAGFRLTSSPDILVPVHFAGGSLPLIFDSGGGNYVIPAGAKQLRLRTAGGLPLEGVGNGSVNASFASVGTIALGSAHLVDQHFVVAPLPYALVYEGRGIVVDGLVGAEFLQSFRTTFDFDASRITFTPFDRPASTPPGAVVEPMLSDGAHAYVRASIDGAAGIFLLDTGDNGDVTVFRRFATEHHLLHGKGLQYLSIGGVGGHLGLERYRLTTFTLGGGTMHQPPVTVSEASAGAFSSRSVAGNIGLRVIDRYHITFDFRRQTVTFVPGKNIDAPFVVDRSGISLNQPDATAFVVLSTVAGGPAAAAGLHVGDRIVAADGRNIAQARLGLLDIRQLVTGNRSFTLTTQAKDGTLRTLTIHPRDLLPVKR
jgi:hypothetical protein